MSETALVTICAFAAVVVLVAFALFTKKVLLRYKHPQVGEVELSGENPDDSSAGRPTPSLTARDVESKEGAVTAAATGSVTAERIRAKADINLAAGHDSKG